MRRGMRQARGAYPRRIRQAWHSCCLPLRQTWEDGELQWTRLIVSGSGPDGALVTMEAGAAWKRLEAASKTKREAKPRHDGVARVGLLDEWHLRLCNPFRHLAFDLGAGSCQPVVVIAPALLRTRLEAIWAVGDIMSGDGVE